MGQLLLLSLTAPQRKAPVG